MRTILLFSFLTLALFFVGCNCDDPRDPECDNYDPCIDAVELSADFEMMHFTVFSNNLDEGNLDTLTYLVDTLVDWTRVLFRAPAGADEYRWRIGDEAQDRLGREIAIDFEGFSGDIEVRLEVSNHVSSRVLSCELVNDSAVVVTRNVHIVEVPHPNSPEEGSQPYFGTYRGFYSDDPNTEVELVVKDGVQDFPINSGPGNLNPGGIIDFPPGCEHHRDDVNGRGFYGILPYYNSFALNDIWSRLPDNVCRPAGLGKYNARTEELIMDYWYINYSTSDIENGIVDTIWGKFTGLKIQ